MGNAYLFGDLYRSLLLHPSQGRGKPGVPKGFRHQVYLSSGRFQPSSGRAADQDYVQPWPASSGPHKNFNFQQGFVNRFGQGAKIFRQYMNQARRAYDRSIWSAVFGRYGLGRRLTMSAGLRSPERRAGGYSGGEAAATLGQQTELGG